MIFSEKHRFIFFAAGKTGTSSIEKALQEYGETLPVRLDPHTHHKHAAPRDVKRKLDDDIWRQYFKFAFVRNPWDWVISNYFWNIRHNEGPIRRRLRRWGVPLTPRKFRESHFWQHWETMKRYRRGTHPDNRFQFSFLANEDGDLLVDFVGRYEHLQEDFDTICQQCSLPAIQLPHNNKGTSRRGSYADYYTDRTRELVAEKYRKDIEFFGYQFGA